MAFEGLLQNYTNKIASTKARLESSLSSILTDITGLNNSPNICSAQNQQKILGLINKTRALNSTIQSLQKSINGVSNTVNSINQILQIIQKVLFIIKSLPVPAMYVTVGIIMTVTTILNVISGNIIQTAGTISQANNVILLIKNNIAGIKQSLALVIQQLKTLTDKIKQCSTLSDDLKNKLDLQQSTLLDNVNLMNNSLPDGVFYKGLKLDIFEERAIDPNIPALRRRAIALNNQGIMVLQGELTYATDKNVLFDELKLLIDKNKLGDNSNITESQIDQTFGFDSKADITAKLNSVTTQLKIITNSNSAQKQLFNSLKK